MSPNRVHQNERRQRMNHLRFMVWTQGDFDVLLSKGIKIMRMFHAYSVVVCRGHL